MRDVEIRNNKNIDGLGGIPMLLKVKELLGRIRSVVEGQEKGQTLIEYALLVLLIAIIVIAVLVLLGPQIATVFNNIRTSLGGL